MPRAPLPFQQVGVIAVGMSLAVWWPAFTLGAWGEIFFDDLLTVWAAATAAFLVAALLPGARKRLGWTSLTLLVPTVVLLIELILPDSDDDLAAVVVALIAALAVVVGIPFMIWALAKVIWPEIGESIPARGKLLVLLTVFVIAVASFLLGANQSRFLTCQDFTISGNSEPPGCTPAT
ncbi:hypothetical protein B7R25_15050 [Subtercola boreus]|uniref:Uncharacterized protein n=1 Tax=Subtercola boreus TaxID=120213 RepID=A0A3E0W9K1_9MICO|nr:hypothetical protein B7R24_15020 [Subtercola boreus]RFA18579.1 hypothetical protein B7R23_15055 [Subtercola boreus]RFA25098.1 hypothetical protein B7R25_15050 [Subtercola boreus]